VTAAAASSSDCATGPAGLRAQLAAQVAQRQVAEVEAALAGQCQVRGERSVAGQPVDQPAAGLQCEQRPLRVVHRLGHGRVGEPAAERRLVVGGQLHEVDVRRVVGPLLHSGSLVGVVRQRRVRLRREPDTAGISGPPAPRAADVQPGAYARGEPGQEGPDLTGRQHPGVDIEALIGLGFDGRQGGVEPLAQHPELQGVEDLVHLVAVPLAQPQVVRPNLERNVAVELGELAVAQHVGGVGPQAVADLALDLIDGVDQRADVAVLLDELGGGLLAEAGHVRQVVTGITA